ncbi:CatB-related O-acetyltransferase [Eubacterium aggregans]|uniref:CatB-related O-acetyltransferase n=1 Tax=Eubacterium aggregans TaxID=81409 RepID=UPI003F321811
MGEEDLAKVAQWKGPTTVGNDVWFGFESLIMPCVTIGDGAIIGSRSVVTKDVPPYTVVAGSPALVIRKCFDDTTIDQLLTLKWWDLPDEQVKEIVPAIMDGDIEAVLERKWLSDAVREVVVRIGAQGKE